MRTQEQIAGWQRRFWTNGELDKLNSLYPDTPMNELVRLLERPASSIYAKAKELGVKRSADFLAGNIAEGLVPAIGAGWQRDLKSPQVNENPAQVLCTVRVEVHRVGLR